MIAYHGTPHGNFSNFNPFSFFTTNKKYAEEYMDLGASIRSTDKQLISPKIIKVEIDLGDSFDLREDNEKVIKIWDEWIESGEWSVRPFLTSNSLPMGGIFEDELITFLTSRGYISDFDTIIFDEQRFKEDNRGFSIVVVNTNKISILK